MYWVLFGPAILVLLTLQNASGNRWFDAADFFFLALLAGLFAARWVEFRAGNPQTASGDPATPQNLRRYILATLLIGLGAWVLANLIGNHWLHAPGA
jgi:peptidoglycan/LPS O-acetylase OafA/YrhL